MLNVFIAYSHKDKDILDHLLQHIRRPLKDRINIWHSEEIIAGQQWDEVIKDRLSISEIILMLISSSFLDSTYIMDTELPTSVRRHKAGECTLIPIIVKKCMWEQEEHFKSLQMLPKGLVPLSKMDLDEGCVHIGEEIIKIIDVIKNNQQKEKQKKSGEYFENIAKNKKINDPFINSMQFVPSGSLTVKNSQIDQIELYIDQFYICKTLVTHKNWFDVCGRYHSFFNGKNEDTPITQVSWNEVQQFLYILSGKTNKSYRLPTESEWVFAAKAGNDHNNFPYAGSYNLDAVGWHEQNAQGNLMPVGLKQPNGIGLFDMCGNVWELCSDTWKNSFYSDEIHNIFGNKMDKESNYKVVKGGSVNSSAKNCSITYRDCLESHLTSKYIGFRLVCDEV